MPQQYIIKFTPDATSDLIKLFDFIEKDSPQNADLVNKRVFRAIDSLAIFPQRQKVYRANRNPDRTIHSLPMPPLIIYYRVFIGDGVVQIVSVRHGARRQPKRFN